VSSTSLGAVGRKRQSSSSRFIGVSRQKATSSFLVHLKDQQPKRRRHVGYFASEEDAARAYDCAAVQMNGPGVKRNFPGEAISELPVTVGEQKKQKTARATLASAGARQSLHGKCS
jgi:hypothetical protein